MIESTVLGSGLTLVTERMAGARSVTIGFWVGTGSRDEADAEAGASHFLEHLLFKGTPTRSARAIAEATDAVGGDMNAYTTKEYTTFYVRMLGEHLDVGLGILSDIMWEPALRHDEVDAERQVILEEVLMHLDEPADVAYERFSAAAFTGHPLGREVLGLPDVVRSLSVDEIRTFLERHYRTENIVVAAAGDVDHERLAGLLDDAVASRSGGGAPDRVAPEQGRASVVVEPRDTEQAQIVLGVRALRRDDPQRYALAVLNHALGGGLSSRLFQKVREERGLCYSIGSERVGFADTGLLSVGAGTAPAHAAEVLELVEAELDELCAHGITARELELARDHVRAGTLLSLEDSGARMSRLGAAMLLQGEIVTPEESIARIEAVGLDEVAEVAAHVLSGPRILAVVGPFDTTDFAGVAR